MMSQPRGLMYPALHKFYSALNSLEKFEKGSNFFDNIAHLDNFFSEYRNITFVLQKSLKHTSFNEKYEELRDKHLISSVGKWLVDKRNEVLKQQPFDLEKKIIITIYSDGDFVSLPEQSFTIDNDVEFSTLIESLKSLLLKVHAIETMFSSEFSFYERGKKEELYEQFISGINSMKEFIKEMKLAVNETCELSNQLLQKIDGFNFYRIPKNMLFIDDYVYYGQEDSFEKGARAELSPESFPEKIPLTFFSTFSPRDSTFDPFQSFVLMHVIIFQMQKTLMPTYVCVYKDHTFAMLSFDGSLKTTAYRKFNEISKKIQSKEIIEIFYVTEMITYSKDLIGNSEFQNMNSKKRALYSDAESLTFFRIGKDKQNLSYYFESEKINDMKYVVEKLANPNTLNLEIRLFQSIIKEFEKING